MHDHAMHYMGEAAHICEDLIRMEGQIESMAAALSKVEGRVYCIGLGGSLANAIHMAADLQKLCWIDAEAPNLALMSAWINDSGPQMAFAGMAIGKEPHKDALFVLSVGGGTDTVSPSIAFMVDAAKLSGMKVFGIVGPHGGKTAERGDHVIKVPVSNKAHITPHTEAFQAVIWHCLVSHPLLQKAKTKW